MIFKNSNYLIDIQNIITIFAHNQTSLIMSKFNDFIQKTIQYILSILDSDFEVKPLEKTRITLIPVFIEMSYRFYEVRLLGTDVCLLEPKDDHGYTPAQMEKQMQIIQSKLNMPAVFLLEHVASYNLNRLISRRINFIIPEKQFFVPSLLVALKKQSVQPVVADTIPPLSTFLLLYHLQKESLEGYTTRKIAGKFDVSYANANRAVRWLLQRGLIITKGDKEKTISFSFIGKVLFDKALPLLSSPIESIGYTDEPVEADKACLSGMNALSVYSMLNPEKDKYYAFSRANWRETGIVLDRQFGKNAIEIWRYDPIPLSENGVVDKLSLYLCLKDNEDERVQIELEQLISNITWFTE